MSLKIGVIVGSNRPIRTGRKVAEWFMSEVENADGTEFELIDLAEVNLPYLDEPSLPSQGDYQHEHTKKWGEKVDGYDGFVFVTPEYNSGYTAVLKNAIDSIYSEWGKKPVAFVGYGALGATRSIEQLVAITAKINMVPRPMTSVKIVESWAFFNEKGQADPAKVKGDPKNLVEDLLWWATTLKEARESLLVAA